MPKSFGPFLEVARIQSEINRLFENLLDLGNAEDHDSAWIPNVDIQETPERLVVRIELPGVEPGDLALSVHGGNLIIQGEKREPDTGLTGRVHLEERAFGRFRRSIHLGVPVNTRQAEAILSDGLLRIAFPKVPNRRGEQVPIEVKTA
jgi:HSP20 family protein